MLRKITILVLMGLSLQAKADCQYALNACNAYVKALEKDNGLLKDKVTILEKEVKKDEDLVSHATQNSGKGSILAAGGVAVGATAVAVGAPLVALGVGLAALVVSLVGK